MSETINKLIDEITQLRSSGKEPCLLSLGRSLFEELLRETPHKIVAKEIDGSIQETFKDVPCIWNGEKSAYKIYSKPA